MQIVDCGKGRFAKVFVDDLNDVEPQALAQIVMMAQMPMMFKHIAVMPDVHLGMGACIGSVIPLEGAVCPNFVGVDIGCGMALYPTGLKFEGELSTKKFWQKVQARWYDHIAVGPRGRGNLTQYDLHPGGYRAQINKKIPLCINKISHAQGYKSVTNMIELQLGTMGGGKNDCLHAA